MKTKRIVNPVSGESGTQYLMSERDLLKFAENGCFLCNEILAVRTFPGEESRKWLELQLHIDFSHKYYTGVLPLIGGPCNDCELVFTGSCLFYEPHMVSKKFKK